MGKKYKIKIKLLILVWHTYKERVYIRKQNPCFRSTTAYYLQDHLQTYLDTFVLKKFFDLVTYIQQHQPLFLQATDDI